MRRLLAAATTLALLLPGCAAPPDAASAAAERWLRAVTGAEEDRGWGLLDEQTQVVSFDGDAEAYVEAASALDDAGMSWTVESERAIGQDQTSVHVALAGNVDALTAFLRDRRLAYAWCRGDTPIGVRLVVTRLSDRPFVGLGFSGDGSETWPCDGDGELEPEFVPSRDEGMWGGEGLIVWNNTEVPLVVRDDLERDLLVPPCQQLSFSSHGTSLSVEWEGRTVGTVELEPATEQRMQFVVIGQRDIYSELTPPQEPLPGCGGLPEGIGAD